MEILDVAPDDGKSGLAININYVKRIPAILKIIEFVSMLRLIFRTSVCICVLQCVFLKIFQKKRPRHRLFPANLQKQPR